MTDVTQRTVMPIGVGARAAQPPDVEPRRAADASPATAAEQVADPHPSVTGGAVEGTALDRGDASLDAMIEGLARDAAALREAVARFEIAGKPLDAPPSDDAPLLDALAREQRVRDDTVELTRGLARITTQSALLLVKFTDSAAAFLQRSTAADEAAASEKRRSPALWVAAAAGLAGIAAVVGALALLQARENARQMDRLQQALVQSIGDNAQAQAAAASALEARVRELASREAAIVAAIQAAAPAAPRADEPDAARREPAKSAASSRNAKRKAVR